MTVCRSRWICAHFLKNLLALLFFKIFKWIPIERKQDGSECNGDQSDAQKGKEPLHVKPRFLVCAYDRKRKAEKKVPC